VMTCVGQRNERRGRTRRVGWDEREDSALDLFRGMMCYTGFVVVHDPVMFGLNEVLEVELDGFDRILLTDYVGRLLANHHLCGVRVSTHRAGDDRRVGHTQAFDTAHAATFNVQHSVTSYVNML